MKDGHQLGEWVESVGLEMYRHLVEKHVPSGDRLVAMTAKQHDNTDLVVRGYVIMQKRCLRYKFFFSLFGYNFHIDILFFSTEFLSYYQITNNFFSEIILFIKNYYITYCNSDTNVCLSVCSKLAS